MTIDTKNEALPGYKKVFYKTYYLFKHVIPRTFLIRVRGLIARCKRNASRQTWPIRRAAAVKPEWFYGWPNNKRFAFIIRHDVESIVGYRDIERIMNIEEELGFRSVFNVLLDVYPVDEQKIEMIRSRGFEIGIHGVVHDARLYMSEDNFIRHARIINAGIERFRCAGFASPSSFHNLDWMYHLNIEYDSSTFDTDPMEPQNDAASTIFPFFVKSGGDGFVEIPYTLPQDFTTFVLLKERTIDIWKRKIDWIVENQGMVFVNIHPDYMRFDRNDRKRWGYSAGLYRELLDYISTRYAGQYWHVLPVELARFCKSAHVR